MVPMERIERSTSPLPRECSTTELHGQKSKGRTQLSIQLLVESSPMRKSFAKTGSDPAFPTLGAGEGNRTLVVSLEGFCSTIELHPRGRHLGFGDWRQSSVGTVRAGTRHRYLPVLNDPNRSRSPVRWFPEWWRGKDSNLRRQSRQIYSLFPLTAREPLLRNMQG